MFKLFLNIVQNKRVLLRVLGLGYGHIFTIIHIPTF
jgi:hypothetical protein